MPAGVKMGGAMYRGRLERDLALWVDRGLVQRPVADALLAELDSRESSFSLGKVLLIIAACLVSAAVLLLVASNWEAIPRVVRVVGIIALIWISYGAAAVLMARGARTVAAGFLILGTAAFGGAIALIGQMYHLSGDNLVVMLVWFLMAWLAALLFRSPALTVFTGVLSWAFFYVFLDENYGFADGLWGFCVPAMAIAVIALVYLTGAARARHLAYMLLLGWLVWLYFVDEDRHIALGLAALGIVGFLVAAVPQSPLHRLARNAGAAPAFYTFVLAMIGLFLLHLEFDEVRGRLVVGIVTLVTSVAAIALSGRDNGAVRYLAYAVFAVEVLYLASTTVGTILGTSGLFLLSGLLVAAVAWVVIRLEKRLSAQTVETRA